MPPTLYLAPTAHAARAHVVAQIKAAQQDNPLAPIYAVVPTAAAADDLRRALGDALNVHVLPFYGLGQRILDAAHSLVRPLSDAAVRRLVRRLLADMQADRELTTFARVRDKPGFIQALVMWLREMKTQGIPPEDVSAHAAQSDQKDQQLARLYENYQRFLQAHDLSDTDGMLWLAAEALEADASLFSHADPCFVLGFDQFSPVQRRILQGLAARVNRFAIYLRWDDAARTEESLALARLRQTRDALIDTLHPQIERLAAHDDEVPPALVHLRQTLFEAPAEAPDPEGAVRAVAAPSREAEVRWALRAIKRLLLNGVPVEQIALLAPTPDMYRRIVSVVAGEYGVPVTLEAELALNPAVAALLNLLRLPPSFPRRATFDALRSPYFRVSWLTTAQIDLLDRLTRERPVVEGRDQWDDALRPLLPLGDAEDEDLGPPPLAATLPAEILEALRAGLAAFFDHVTPPVAASYHDYALWLQTAILGLFTDADDEPSEGQGVEVVSLHMIACCAGHPTFAQRDLLALDQVTSALGEIVEVVDLIPFEREAVAWETFRDELLDTLTGLCQAASPERGAVRFGSLLFGREGVVDHLFVLGLSEAEFPHPPDPDPFYAPAERAAHPLPLIRTDPAESATLWWQAVGSARRSLTLLRPRIDAHGAPWQPSPYWGEVVGRVAGLDGEIELLAIDAFPLIEDAASPGELLVALARQGGGPVPPGLQSAWEAAQAGYVLMQRRVSRDLPGAFEGVLAAPEVRARLQERYGPSHGWSVSRLNRYGHCPFGFFSDFALELEPRADPEIGLNTRQRGQLLHRALELLYRQLTADSIAPCLVHRDSILARLEAVCDALFSTAPARYGFRPGALWRYEQQELRRQLRALIVHECGNSGEQPAFIPYMQEVRFGLPRSDLGDLELETGDGVAFRLHGVVDRVDRDAEGNVRVIDYKSGSTTYSETDVREGRALQTALYAEAVERLLPGIHRVVESCYLHIAARETSGRVTGDGAALREAAIARAGAMVAKVREGRFPAAPGKADTCRWCGLQSLCHVTRQGRLKAGQGT